MSLSPKRSPLLTLVKAAAVASFGIALVIACGQDEDSGAACDNPTLEVLFSPMYSEHDGVHTFQIPVVVNGVTASSVKWSVSDSSKVAIADDDSTGGILLTTLAPGTVQVTARAGGLCGTSTLTIASAASSDWDVGSARYNNGISLRLSPDGGRTTDVACTNCHGATANGAFKDVAHTPTQTGGFSDADLKSIITQGTVPAGGYFDPNIIPYAQWQQIHRWTMTDDELKGVIVYLRALTPETQEGSANFGGRFDGGFPPGSPPDGGAVPDAG